MASCVFCFGEAMSVTEKRQLCDDKDDNTCRQYVTVCVLVGLLCVILRTKKPRHGLDRPVDPEGDCLISLS